MENAEVTQRENFLARERALVIDLENIKEQLIKTIFELAAVRRKLKANRHLFVVRDNDTEINGE